MNYDLFIILDVLKETSFLKPVLHGLKVYIWHSDMHFNLFLTLLGFKTLTAVHFIHGLLSART